MVSEEEIKELVNKQWLDRRSSDDELLALIGVTNVNRNKKIDYTNLKLDDTNLKLDELVKLSGGNVPKKDILPGDFGVSLAAGNSGDIITCVINGRSTNAIAKENIAKYISITVVPGGSSEEPYVVSSSLVINEPILTIQQGVKTNITTTVTQLSTTSVPIYKVITVKVRSLGTGTYIALGNLGGQEFRLTAVGDSHDVDFIDDLTKLYVITDAGNTGALEWIGG